MGRTAVEDFVHHLTRAERSPLTIKNYRCDLAAFAIWFRDTTGDELTPAHITPTDLRDYKRFLVDHRGLKPSSVNRQLATLKSFLTWAAGAGLLPCRKRSFRNGGGRAGSIAASNTPCAGHESLETTRRYCTPSLKDLEHAVELIGEEV